MKNENPLVYSTESGRIRPKEIQLTPTTLIKTDGIVRIQYQRAGRKGKGVCVISGIDWETSKLQDLASWLKKKCGTGGSVKEGTIEIQGDNREQIKLALQTKGFNVKFSGG